MGQAQITLIIRSVQRGVRWLKEIAESLSDTRDIAITISALIATERNPHSQLVQRLVSALKRQQGPGGSWKDELWDTVWAAKALHEAGEGDSTAVKAALGFMRATQDQSSGTWYEEPFETILVLDAMSRLAPDHMPEMSNLALEWLASLQQDSGRVIGIRYTGMVASLFSFVSNKSAQTKLPVAELALHYIREDLENKPIWSSAAWSNYYPFKALIDSGATITDPSIEKAIDWFLKAQDDDGKWMQVSRVHDTAMAVLALSALLQVPLVDVSVPRIGILNISKENGTIRVSFHGPGAGAITPAEKMKISDQIRADLSQNQQWIASVGRLRAKSPLPIPSMKEGSFSVEIEKAGRYAYGHLIPPRIQATLEATPADHIRLDIDERLIDLPWEVIHDGTEFLSLRYAVGRRLLSEQNFALPRRHPHSPQDTRVLVVADPTGDLPAAKHEGISVAGLLRDRCHMQVDEFTDCGINKKDFLLALRDYDIVHYAGHASHSPSSPDESCLSLSDGEIQAFEIARFVTRSPAVVFLNACWSAEELPDPDSYSPMMRGLGRTFLYAGVNAFLGYLIPVPDQSATKFAIAFYEAVAQGQTIGESVRRARISARNEPLARDLTWCSAVLYGDPTARAIETIVGVTP